MIEVPISQTWVGMERRKGMGEERSRWGVLEWSLEMPGAFWEVRVFAWPLLTRASLIRQEVSQTDSDA